MEVPDETTLSTSYVFRGIEYIITMIIQGGNSLTVEVEDRLTADQWRAQFDSACKLDICISLICFLFPSTKLVINEVTFLWLNRDIFL